MKVNDKFYDGWGDYTNTKFDKWWKENGENLLPKHKVAITKNEIHKNELIHLSVPTTLTPTDAANQVRDLLISHYKEIGHIPKPKRNYTLTEGAEIKVSALRAYLHTYDAHQQLISTKVKEKVTAKELLAEVRRFYMARSEKWKNTKRKVEGLPPALAGDIFYDKATNSVKSKGSDIGAERAIRRYLAIANNLVHAAAKGDFPSKNYYVN
ncbi:hypothetical protein B9Z46_10845 [Limnohabitans sp. Hippo4]|nr:hypothetical protein B9Z46_10845 [Limnohabitans sp. Hippo4]